LFKIKSSLLFFIPSAGIIFSIHYSPRNAPRPSGFPGKGRQKSPSAGDLGGELKSYFFFNFFLAQHSQGATFMPTALYPGTFDPITFGHIDIIVRASKIFKKVIAVVGENPHKNPVFSAQERIELIREAVRDVAGIEVISYNGLIANCLRDYNATVIIRGLRALSDFDYEFQMAFTNRNINAKAETVFLMPSAKYSYLNSTLVKDIAKFGGDVGAFVPEHVMKRLYEKVKAIKA
jgi:pantetheine-phosphate adenylyltransferase